METNFILLAEQLIAGNIDKEEFINRYFENKDPSEDHVLQLFEKAIANRDGDLIEEAILLLATGYFQLDHFSLYLCSLLKENGHIKHEDIASMLQEVKSPQTVECLYEATELQFAYLGYDDTYQFARKCIKALAGIRNENAYEKLTLLANSENNVIAGYANKELHRINAS